jgi:chromosome partitioning protein
VISGTQTVVISGTESSWYREPESALSLYAGKEIGAPNLSNIESFGFLLTEQPRFHPVWKSPKTPHITLQARLNQTGIVSKTTLSLDSLGGRKRQRLRVVAVDADRKEESENCWLDWSKQPAKKGLTKLVLLIGLAPGAPRREALEIACTVDHIVTDGPPRFAVRTRSALLVTDVALTPPRPSSSGKGEPVELQKLLKKARTFRPDLHPRFYVNCYWSRTLIVLESAKSLAEQDLPTPCGRVGPRVVFTNVTCSSQFAWKPRRDGQAARADDRAHWRNHECRPVTACDHKSAFAQRPGDSEARRRRIEDRAVESAAKPQRFIARLPIDVTPELRGRIKVVAFQRGQMVTEMPRDLRANFVKCHGVWFDE